tara:strand:- start:4665 stop:5837 length:1173 start_codon:yes stop_codon:yes gene_type:complete
MKKNCPICLSKTNLFLEKKKQPTKIFPTSNLRGLKKKDLNIYFCKRCQYGFQYPIPTNKQIDQFYLEEQDEYVSLIEKPEIGIDQEIEKINFIKKSINKQFSKKKEKIKIVEVGGFDGFCIKNIFNAKKSEKILIEPNKKGCKIAEKHGLTTINSYLNTNIAKNYKNYFDIVICKHAIEHVKNIKLFSKNLIGLLKKGGFLFLETPDLERVIKKGLTRVFILQHLHYFSKKTLEILFDKLILKSYQNNIVEDTSSILLFQKNDKQNIKKFRKLNISVDLFKESIKNQKKDLEKFIKKNFQKKIYIYGASSVVNDIFSTYRLRKEKISAIIDSDRNKEKKRLPIVKNLPIYHIKNDKLDKKSAIIISTVDKRAVKNILKDNNFKSDIFNFY